MRALEMSILAAGAVVSLFAGGGAAKLALAPLDAAYAGHQQAVAENAEAREPVVPIADRPAPEMVAYRTDVAPPAGDAWDAKPVAVPSRDDAPATVTAINDEPASGPDNDTAASDANGQADVGPEAAAADSGEDATPAPRTEPASDSPPAEPAAPRQDPEG